MIHELILTSVPRGIDGGSGFQPVLRTRDMKAGLEDRLKLASGYSHPFRHGDARNPVVYVHRIERVSGSSLHVLGRIADAGSDHTGRSNFIGHLLALEAADARRKAAGPAEVARRFPFRTKWSDPPREESPPTVVGGDRMPAPCSSWRAAGLDAGLAGDLAEAAMKGQEVLLVTRPGDTGDTVLSLFADALALVEPSRRWQVTFNTCAIEPFQALWTAIRADLPQAQALRSHAGRVIDLTADARGSDGEYARFARDGTAAAVLPWQRPAAASPGTGLLSPASAAERAEAERIPPLTVESAAVAEPVALPLGPVASSPFDGGAPPAISDAGGAARKRRLDEVTGVGHSDHRPNSKRAFARAFGVASIVAILCTAVLIGGWIALDPDVLRKVGFVGSKRPATQASHANGDSGGGGSGPAIDPGGSEADLHLEERVKALLDEKKKLLESWVQLESRITAFGQRLGSLQNGPEKIRLAPGRADPLQPLMRQLDEQKKACIHRSESVPEKVPTVAKGHPAFRERLDQFEGAVKEAEAWLKKTKGDLDNLVAAERDALANWEAGEQQKADEKRQKDRREEFERFAKEKSLYQPLPVGKELSPRAQEIELCEFPIDSLGKPDLHLAVPDDFLEPDPESYNTKFSVEVVEAAGEGAATNRWEIRYAPSKMTFGGDKEHKKPRPLAAIEARDGKIFMAVEANELPRKPGLLLRRSVLVITAKDPDAPNDRNKCSDKEIRFIEPKMIGDIMIDLLDDRCQSFQLPVAEGSLPVRSVQVVVETEATRDSPERRELRSFGEHKDFDIAGCLAKQQVPGIVELGHGDMLGIEWSLSLGQAALNAEPMKPKHGKLQDLKDRVSKKLKNSPDKAIATFEKAARAGKADLNRRLPVPFRDDCPDVHFTFGQSITCFHKKTQRPDIREDLEKKVKDAENSLRSAQGRADGTTKSEQDIASASRAVEVAKQNLLGEQLKILAEWKQWYLKKLDDYTRELAGVLKPYLEPSGKILRIMEINSLAKGPDEKEYKVPLVVYDPKATPVSPKGQKPVDTTAARDENPSSEGSPVNVDD